MEKDKLYKRINKFFDNHIFVVPVAFLDPRDENFKGSIEMKFRIVGEKQMIVVGTWTDFVDVDVDILSTDNPILKMFFDNNVEVKKIFRLDHSIESYLESKLEVFNIKRVNLNQVNWVGE